MLVPLQELDLFSIKTKLFLTWLKSDSRYQHYRRFDGNLGKTSRQNVIVYYPSGFNRNARLVLTIILTDDTNAAIQNC